MIVHTSPSSEVSAPAATVRPAHRADLDGLRGLAIALVVAFHVWFGRVSGGVDVFLALSGFFFVGSLLRVAESGAPLDPRPVLRRIGRRLLTPLILVLAATTVAALVLVPFPQWYRVAEQSRASLLFFQNWHLARTGSDYLAADPMVSPLQHLWSIAVQGQFYLGAIVVVFTVAWMLRRWNMPVRAPLAVVLAALTAASFAYATLSTAPQSWSYYDSGARMWELTAAGLLACIAPRLRVPRAVRILLGLIGLIIILGCGIVLDGGALFPGPWALVPIGATIALIVAGVSASSADTPTAAVLSSRPLVRLGSIAYALYLWHWPLLIGYLLVRGHPSVGLLGGLAVIAASLVLAEATTRWVETPIRTSSTGRWRTVVVATSALAGITLAAASTGWVAHVDRAAERVEHSAQPPAATHPGAAAIDADATEPDRVYPPLLVADRDLPPSTHDGCIAQHTNREPLTCTYGDPMATRRMALVGGSHSEHWLGALDIIGRERGFRIDTYLKVGCPLSDPRSPLVEESPTVECDRWSTKVLAELAADPPDLAFTTSTRPKEDGDGPGDFTPFWYVELWETLADHGIDVVGIRDNPWLKDDGVGYTAADCLASGGTATTCAVPRADALDPVDPAVAAAAHLPSVRLIDLSDSLCRTEVCRVAEGNVLIYRDDDHLTTTYVRTLAPALDRRLGPATGWW
ncbi:MAG: acyltransferase [Rhodococcus sp.]|uniref:acyltransferase family protein n=1 Tax=Rhodococcus TaxID=1827 RepID=UPI0016A6D5EB|nr:MULTISPECIES: acyltransferase family protein [Rhodococcus]NLV79755.1 acyltransferase [Rhodococcus sp. (in: high G+C Gram-positive bacteria)]